MSSIFSRIINRIIFGPTPTPSSINKISRPTPKGEPKPIKPKIAHRSIYLKELSKGRSYKCRVFNSHKRQAPRFEVLFKFFSSKQGTLSYAEKEMKKTDVHFFYDNKNSVLYEISSGDLWEILKEKVERAWESRMATLMKRTVKTDALAASVRSQELDKHATKFNTYSNVILLSL